MAVTVQTSVTDNQATSPFYYLRITGLPYYIFATVNPNASGYGSFAWSTPTGYTASTWAQRGLQLPDDAIDQKLPDIIGGVATPAHIKLSVIDFPDLARSGQPTGKQFFSRLFAPGRALVDSSLAQGVLSNPVASFPGTDSVIEVAQVTGTFTAPGDVYIGAETVGISAASSLGGGAYELTIADRNKYVCYGNRGDGGSYWPPDPYHVVAQDASGNPTSPPLVLSEASDVIGRTAALWMGHMRPDGNPEPETSSTCLLLGRVTDIEIGTVGGMFDITIESITADLNKGKVAPGLGHGTIQDGFYLSGKDWLTFVANGTEISISASTYTVTSLANAVNAALAAATIYLSLQVFQDGDDQKFGFLLLDPASTRAYVSSSKLNASGNADPVRASLLHALGFDPTSGVHEVTANASGPTVLLADRPIARVFVPTYGSDLQSLPFIEPLAYLPFFINQADGTGTAWVRYGDGQIVKITATANNQITTGNAYTNSPALTGASDDQTGGGTFYYVEKSGTPMVDQVVVYRQTDFLRASSSFRQFLGRLLASSDGYSTWPDGVLNVFPVSVGMGWNVLLTASQWTITDDNTNRICIVDSATKWIDLFKVFSREHGLFLAWDPSANGIALRQLIIPNSASATGVTLSESNRARPDDRTSQRVDRSSIRTSWKIQPGFSLAKSSGGIVAAAANLISPRFLGDPPPLMIVDARARSMYPNDDREEPLEDKTLIGSDELRVMIQRLLQTYTSPWTICSRSMNKRGMLLSPGTYHRIVDNTLVNPFTGATGIVSGDDVFAFLTRVSMTPSDGKVTIEFVINSSSDNSLYRQWSPTALVDFTNNAGGYTRGYNSGTKTLALVQHYSATSDEAVSFAAGDTIRVINRDNAASTTSQTDTIVSTGTNTITVTTGLSALPSGSESIVVLQKYNSATTTRKTGATKVAWQGDGDTGVIQGSSTARLNKWA